MTIYEVATDSIKRIDETTFTKVGLREREDLQRLLRDNIDVIAGDTLIIAEEFGEWEESRRRIDLLGLDKEANLIVIELKRTEEGGHMELQAIRYAAMVSTMTFDKAVDVFSQYLQAMERDEDPYATILEFLDWEEPDEERFGQDVRIVLASAEFSKELTTAVMWLNDRALDIRCIRLKPYLDGNRVLLDVQQIVPLPEAEQYQVQMREKTQKEKTSRRSGRDFTRFDITIDGEVHTNLPKRRAVLLVIQHLCRTGLTPEEIISAATFRKNSTFRSINGVFDTAEEFVASCLEEQEKAGKVFDSRRFFTKKDELIESNGRTYCVSNQWGGRAIKWIGQVLEVYPDRGIALTESKNY